MTLLTKTAAALAAGALGGASLAQTAPPAPAPTEWTGDLAVNVAAHRHGPALWRVSKTSGEAWVLAVPEAALMADFDGATLQRVFDSAQVVKTAPRAHVDLLGAAWFMLKGDYRLPRGETLDSLLGPEDWARLSGHLRAAKINPDDYRHLRPGFATIIAWSQVMQAQKAAMVSDRVGQLAEKRHLKVSPIADYPGGPLLSKLAGISQQDGVVCLRQTLDDLDFARDHLAAASRAWATGDLAGLRQNYRTEHGFDCVARTEGLSGAVERSVSDTVRDVQKAMSGPPTLFVLSLGSFVRKGGVVEALRAQGYTVEEPGG
jgi:uncharacterized protein YbaP (TraB family)